MANAEIRRQLAKAGIKHWQLAEAVGISKDTLCVWLRHELTGERLERVTGAVNALCGGGEHDDSTGVS